MSILVWVYVKYLCDPTYTLRFSFQIPFSRAPMPPLCQFQAFFNKKTLKYFSHISTYPKRCPAKAHLWIITSFKFQVLAICVLVYRTPVVGIKIVPVAGDEIIKMKYKNFSNSLDTDDWNMI